MNRVEFMNQLERLLQGIAPGEREEALQYYNDYFDDAGSENEQAVIEALGNPARVAENIRRELSGSGGEAFSGARPSDRAMVEYGKEREEDGKNPPFEREAETKSAEKAGMPPWAIALLVTLLIFGSPVVLGLLCVVFGVVIMWYALILAAGVAAVALLGVLIVLVVTGIICCFVNPWVGMALVGSGLICGGIGLLFLMLTTAMAGVATPAFWRGVGRLFRRKRAAA